MIGPWIHHKRVITRTNPTKYRRKKFSMNVPHGPYKRRTFAPDRTPKMNPMSFANSGLCADLNPQLWDHTVDGETPTHRAERIARATTFCHACPVTTECLVYARSHRWTQGVWGGEFFDPQHPTGLPIRPVHTTTSQPTTTEGQKTKRRKGAAMMCP